MSHEMLNAMLGNEKMSIEHSKQCESPVNMPAHASQARGLRDSLVPLPTIRLPHAPPMKSSNSTKTDSEDDTEPEEPQEGIQPSFGTLGSFDAYHTAATSPATSIQQNETLTPARAISPSPSASPLRRSISADRVTMRPTKSPNAPPPLVRAQSEGQTLTSATQNSAYFIPPAKSPTKPSFLTAPTTANRARASSVTEANAVLNTYSGRSVYSLRTGLVYTSSDTESSSDQMSKRQPEHARSTRPSVSPLVTQPLNSKGKGRAILSLDADYDTDTTNLSLSDALPSPRASMYRKKLLVGSSDDTDEDKLYDNIPGDVSDPEEIDISTHIPTTASMPPLPPPTVSRSRSSSRSLPSAFKNDIPPVPPLPPFVLLGGRAHALPSPKLGSESADQRSLQTPTPTQAANNVQPPTPSPASASSSFSYSSAAPITTPAPASGTAKTRQRSISESGGGSGAGSGSGSGGRLRGRLTGGISQVLRKSPSPSPGRGIEHIKPPPTTSKARPKYTIAFIGSSGCGKTTTIDRASKMGNSKLKAETSIIPVCYGDTEITVKSRDAAVVVDKSRDAYPMTTLEFDSAPFINALKIGAEFWPSNLPHVDGVVLCYDASRQGNEAGSFEHIQPLNDAFAALRFPIIWVACKSDWVKPPKKTKSGATPRVLPEGIVSPQEVFIKAGNARTGLIEVTKNTTYGKEQMRNLLTWMYKAIGRSERERQEATPGSEYLNHASPEVFDRKIQSSSKPRHVPTALPLSSVPAEPPDATHSSSPAATPKSPLFPASLLSPQRTTRARSMSDLLSQAARDRVAETSAAVVRKASAAVSVTNLPRATEDLGESRPEERADQAQDSQDVDREPQPSEEQTSGVIAKPKYKPDPFAFATLDVLVTRFCGGVIPGLNSRFNNDFMLTYRRFASPRELLLCIIRSLRALEGEERMRAIRILSDCLVEWARAYPTDFAAPGAIGPLENLIRIMVENSMEGTDELLGRLEILRNLKDDALDWAKPTLDFIEHPDSDTDHDTDSRPRSSEVAPASRAPSSDSATRPDTSATPVTDSAVAGSSTPRPKLTFSGRSSAVTSPLPVPEADRKELLQAAKLLLTEDPEDVAEEITRVDLQLFLDVKPRDWMRHAYVARDDRDPESHRLDQIAYRFEKIGNWVASLMLASDRRRYRGKMFEFFIRVAAAIRTLNNFAALHTVIAAMDKVYSSDDGPAIEEFVQAGEVSWNKWLSMRVLILSSNGGAYKTALKHTTQPLIPTMAIHTSDLVRVMSNGDFKEDNPELIHWGKFQIIAKIVWQMTDLQTRLRASTSYDFGPHPSIARLIDNAKPMSEEVIIEKTFPTPGEVAPAKGGLWTGRMIRKVLG